MDPKPFTYEYFIQAVQSLKDDMLMYYIDEAVAIYCRIKGKSVGPVLPEIKRAAIYASAFGQILRPDLEGYGRNYADILADIYHTTALFIIK